MLIWNNKSVLLFSALYWASANAYFDPNAGCTETHTTVEDAQCSLCGPHRMVLEPSPAPSPLPDTDTTTICEMKKTPSPTVSPTPAPPACLIEKLQIIELPLLIDSPVLVYDGATLNLNDLPPPAAGGYTIQAIPFAEVAGEVTAVKFFVDGVEYRTDNSPLYTLTPDVSTPFLDWNLPGEYTIAAYGVIDGVMEPVDDDCVYTITVEYGNSYVCDGLITHFSLYDVASESIVPGFEVLEDGQELVLADLPNYLTILAHTNGFELPGAAVQFDYNDSPMFAVSPEAEHFITGKYVLVHRYNIGGGAITDGSGRDWEADPGPSSGGGAVHDTCGERDDQLYCSNRWFWSTATYSIDVPSNDEYLIRLHFSEAHFYYEGQRVFDVEINGELVLDDFDIFEEAGGKHQSYIFEKVLVTEGPIDIVLKHVTDNPKISGIEILGTAVHPPYDVALGSLVKRFNVGGQGVTNDIDLGLDWEADPKGTGSWGGYGNIHDSWCTSGISDIYCSNRWFWSSDNSDYEIAVPSAGAYVVRMHFSEAHFGYGGARRFNVFLNDEMVVNDFDIFTQAGGKFENIAVDKVVTMSEAGNILFYMRNIQDNAKISGIEVYEAILTELEVDESANGNSIITKEFTPLREGGAHTFRAYTVQTDGTQEPGACEVTLNVESDWGCLQGMVRGFTLVDTTLPDMSVPVPGYEFFTGSRVLDLAELPASLAINVTLADDADAARFYFNATTGLEANDREDSNNPYSSNGDTIFREMPIFNTDPRLQKLGLTTLDVTGRNRDTGAWDDRNLACSIELNIFDSSITDDPEDPDTIVDLEEEEGDNCIARANSGTESPIVVMQTLVELVEYVAETDTLKFKTKQFVKDLNMDWVTTSFVTKSGVEVCDKVEDVAFGLDTGFTYEALCYEGYAYADIYVYDDSFPDDFTPADASHLPLGCRNVLPDKVVKYTYVFACDCGPTTDIPDEVTKNDPEPPVCIGAHGNVWGDPHVVGFQEAGTWGWGCQNVGEHVVMKATLEGLDYDFQLTGKFSDWDYNSWFSWIVGVHIDSDIQVQLSIAEEANSLSNWFANMPVNFYVNGEQRLLTEGSGDHRLIVSVHSYTVELYFVSSGISVRVLTRPRSVTHDMGSSHIGSISAFVCVPDDNPNIVDITGMLGTTDAEGGYYLVNNDGSQQTSWPSNTDIWCAENYCIDTLGESKFIYESSTYDFEYYNQCDQASRRDRGRHLSECTIDDLHDDARYACNSVSDSESCVFDACAALQTEGEEASILAALEAKNILFDIAYDKSQAEITTLDDARCCSHDYKTCATDVGSITEAGTCGFDKYTCESDACGDMHWLYFGAINEGPLVDCLYKDDPTTCTENSDCCPGLDCFAGTCGPDDSRRRLNSASGEKFSRPDLPSGKRKVHNLSKKVRSKKFPGAKVAIEK